MRAIAFSTLLGLSAAFGLSWPIDAGAQAQGQGQATPDQARGQTPDPTRAGPQARQGQAKTGTVSRIPITEARDILGTEVRDAKGESGGQVDYMIIDLASGDVRYLLIGSGGPFDVGEELVAVPWQASRFVGGEDTPIRLTRPFEEIKQAPRFTEQQLSELSRPMRATQIYDFYAVPVPADQRPQGRPPSLRPEQEQPAGQQPPGQQAQGQPPGQGMMLVGRQVVTMLVPPLAVPAREIAGASVKGPTGATVGEIDRLMVDTAHGRIAYVLVSRGGFLGIGEEWVPVPFTALQWSPESEAFQVAVAENKLRQVPALRKDEPPATVSATQLEQLYARFGVQPYWQQLAQQP